MQHWPILEARELFKVIFQASGKWCEETLIQLLVYKNNTILEIRDESIIQTVALMYH